MEFRDVAHVLEVVAVYFLVTQRVLVELGNYFLQLIVPSNSLEQGRHV